MGIKDLINQTRYGSENTPEKGDPKARSEFKRDFDRIVFNPAFRRLQGKTQVFPFPENDHTHNRLTHSLEVYSIARSLGTIVANELNQEDIKAEDVGDFVGAAALAHDIGNSPFGHTGEKAFSKFFEESCLIASFSDKEKADLIRFEGNAVGFRIMTHSKPYLNVKKGGIGLTYSTIASFVKYPTRADLTGKTDNVSEKKHSYFSSDQSIICDVFTKLGVKEKSKGKWARFPFAFLVEAADDIAYHIIDFEDGYRNGLLDYQEVKNEFIPIIMDNNNEFDESILNVITHDKDKVSFLRAKAINSLIYQASEVFKLNWDKISNYEFETALCKLIKSNSKLSNIYNISDERLYNSKSVVEIELAGYEIITGLLDIFLTSTMKNTNSHFSQKVRKLIPPEYYYCDIDKTPYSGYELVLNISEFIFGMTDACALNLYKKLKGIKLPNM